jgi:hypothetical protein
MKITNSNILLFIMIIVFLQACSKNATNTPPSIITTSEISSSEGLQTFNGNGYSIQYPIDAKIENNSLVTDAKARIQIIGPEIFIKPGNADWVYQGPAYLVNVDTYDNSNEKDAETWARNYILAAWKNSIEKGYPIEGPITKEGIIREKEVGKSVVAGYPSFWAQYFGGDHNSRVYFFSNKKMIIAISYSEYPIENQPVANMQTDICALILNTFRLM